MAQNISKKFSKVGANIKKIRTVKKISQADFAALFSLARPSVGAYEEGRSEPKIETIIDIANYFRISIDVLLTRELTVSEIYSMDQLNKKLDSAHGKDKIQEPLPTQKMDHGISLIRVKDYVEYIINHTKSDFLSTLEMINVPVKKKGIYRAFEMNGSEMEYQQQGLHHGDVIVGKATEKDAENLTPTKIYVVVHPDQIIVRRLDHIGSKFLTFTTDDPNYEALKIQISEILELWEVKLTVSRYLKKPSLIEERLLQLEKDLMRLRKDVKLD